MMDCEIVISDDDCDLDNFAPKIISSESLSSSENGSTFSGFSTSHHNSNVNKRLIDDLEIIDEVVRDVRPGVRQKKPLIQQIPYRQKKLEFQWVKVKEENQSNNEIRNTNLQDQGYNITPNKKRSFAAMRPSFSSSEVEKKQKLNSSSREEERPPSSCHCVDETVLGDSEDEYENEENSQKKEKQKQGPPSLCDINDATVCDDAEDGHRSEVNSQAKVEHQSYPLRNRIADKGNEQGDSIPLDIDYNGNKDHLKDAHGVSNSGRSTPARSEELCEDIEKEKASELRQSGRLSNIIRNNDYGRLVWGKTGSSRPWPAVIISYNKCLERKPPIDEAWLLWFGDYRITQVPLKKVDDFIKNFKRMFVNNYHQSYNAAVLECLKEVRQHSGMALLPTKKAYIKWGENGLTGCNDWSPGKDQCSPVVERYLGRIRKMRLREKSSSSDASFFPTSSSNSDDSNAEERSTWKPKAALLKAVKNGESDIEKICIACDRVNCEVVAKHPYFLGGTCSACKDELEDLSSFVSDGTSRYCCVCGSPGEITLCDGDECDKGFCTGCIELLVSPKTVSEIMDTDPWFCFLCSQYTVKTHGLLKPRPDWQEKVASQPQNIQEELPEVEDETPDISCFPQKPLRVLSLFDGISTGLCVLDKLQLDVEVYYASEINESAKIVSDSHYGRRIVKIGDVQAVSDKKLKEMCPIDLLIGGSPCNDLSCVNPNRKGLFDPTGTGILFFHYFRALKTIMLHNKGSHLFWLFENVNHMPREFKSQINMFLGREPVLIDAKFFSPQSRPRCFWGNIPDMYKPLPREILNKSYPLQNYATKVCNRTAIANGINCVTTNSNSLRPVFLMNDKADFPWITELEQIFGFPAHYTDVGNLTVRERQALLGRAWSVGVVEYILKPLKKYYRACQNKRIEIKDSSVNEISAMKKKSKLGSS